MWNQANRRVCGACLLAVVVAGSIELVAQQPAPKSPAAATRPAAPPAAAKAPTSVDDAAKKGEILSSKRWRRAMFEMNEWLNAQKLYDAKQVAAIKSSFNARVSKMSAAELQFMLSDMEAKFQILETPEAQDARAWLAQYLSLLADKKREEVISRLPNVATMTADQLRDEIARIQERRGALERQEAAVSQLRATDANPWTQSTKMAQQAYIRDHQATGGYSSPYRSPVGKRPFEDVKTTGSNVSYYVGAYGGFGMIFNGGF
jgi:hypothetical protein